MYIGTLEIKIKIYSSFSLKDKRKVLRSIFDKVDHRFNVSYSEVGDQDILNIGTLGFSCVSGDYTHCREIMDRLVEFLYEDFSYEIIDYRIDVI